MVVIAERLVEMDRSVGFIGFEDRLDRYGDVLHGHRIIACAPEAPPDDLAEFGSLFVMNDWGVETQGLVRLARRRGVRTIARVEGVQDFRDIDTNRRQFPYLRLPYLAADLVLAQGNNDERRLARPGIRIVGNGRLESLFRGPERSPTRSGRVVINSNFTYGVHTDARGPFLRACIDACERNGLTAVISQHPSERPLPPRFEGQLSTEPMSELLHRCDALISRFSTVPYEAMAIGTPFVYFNPHGERVPDFLEPEGAFESAADPDALAAAVPRAIDDLGSYRARAEAFFRQQVDMSTEPSPVRTARAIVDALEP